MENEGLIKYCLDNLDFETLTDLLTKEYSYPYISLCAVDAVFSINTRYEAVQNIINRIKKSDALVNSLVEFREWIGKTSSEKYFNRQKVAKILKIDILKKFIQILLDYNFNNKEDFKNFINNEKIDKDLDDIFGIGEVTISYFFMLSGDENSIKPDRHIKKFISDGLGEKSIKTINEEFALNTLKNILPELQKKYSKLTLRSLDHLIWKFQRGKNKKK